MTTRTTAPQATATRIDGNLYDVTYPGTRDMDRGVPYSYLDALAKRGYRVRVEQGTHRGPGEPAHYVIDEV
jgi:hypothetical protein